MNPWLRNLLCGGGGGGGGVVLPPAGRTFLMSKSSLILDEGAGNPTWSRATKAWGFNELGYLEEIASGCAFFGGARLIYNTGIPDSEDLTVAAWTKSNVTAPSADTLVCSSGTSIQRAYPSSPLIDVKKGEKWYCRVRFSYVDHPFVQIRGTSGLNECGVANFNLSLGTYSVVGGNASMTLISAGVYDCAVWGTASVDSASGSTVRCVMYFVSSLAAPAGDTFAGDGVKSVKATRMQLTNITGYDDSYVPEYVSVGVLSAPFHGAGIDGAKYFETDWQGAPIPAANLLGFRREAAATNNVLYCRNLTNNSWIQTLTTGSEITTNGIFDSDTNWTKGSGWSISAGVATRTGVGAISNLAQALPISQGTAYLVGCDVAVSSGNITATFGGGATVNGITRTATGTYSEVLIPNSGNYELRMSASSSFVGTLDNVSIKVAAVQPAMTATGIDGIANTATTLTAFAADAIILQPITLASAVRCASAYVKRRTGTGTISFTQDGGSTWTDITSQINSSTWSRVQITATLANPSVGFKISTSGDAIDVDCVQNEAGAVATSPIVTTTSAVTRNADSLTYQTAGNIDLAVGTIYGEIQTPKGSNTRMLVQIGDGYAGITSAGVDSWRSMDGTTTITATGLSDITTAKRKRAVSWGGATQSSCGDGIAPTSGAFDGAFGSGATIAIGPFTNGYVGPVAIYNYQMTDAELQAITA